MDDDLDTTPMYVEDFDKKNTRPDLAFWGRALVPPCHPTAGFDVQYQGAKGTKPVGLIELCCHECKKKIGKIVVANNPRLAYPKKPVLLS